MLGEGVQVSGEAGPLPLGAARSDGAGLGPILYNEETAHGIRVRGRVRLCVRTANYV